MRHNIDKHTCSIITANIEVLLNHCLRFYDRQFVTRQLVNKDVLSRFEDLMIDYFDSDKPQQIGLPTVNWCAEKLHFSSNYFGDLVKKETGKSAIEYIHFMVINKVKDLLLGSDKTVSEIAYEVGVQYPHHLSRMFKKNHRPHPQRVPQTSQLKTMRPSFQNKKSTRGEQGHENRILLPTGREFM